MTEAAWFGQNVTQQHVYDRHGYVPRISNICFRINCIVAVPGIFCSWLLRIAVIVIAEAQARDRESSGRIGAMKNSDLFKALREEASNVALGMRTISVSNSTSHPGK